jgi:hypothetical protein
VQRVQTPACYRITNECNLTAHSPDGACACLPFSLRTWTSLVPNIPPTCVRLDVIITWNSSAQHGGWGYPQCCTWRQQYRSPRRQTLPKNRNPLPAWNPASRTHRCPPIHLVPMIVDAVVALLWHYSSAPATNLPARSATRPKAQAAAISGEMCCRGYNRLTAMTVMTDAYW